MIPIISFPLFYIKEVIVGVCKVTLDIIRPKPRVAPVVLRLPLVGLTDRQRLLLACLISMTPGTLSIGESEGGSIMLIHSLYGSNDPEGDIDHLVNNYYPFVKSLPI